MKTSRVFKIVYDGNCAGGGCPTIYQTEEGSYIVQGKKLDANEKASLNIPLEEDAVEIPKSFLEDYIKGNK